MLCFKIQFDKKSFIIKPNFICKRSERKKKYIFRVNGLNFQILCIKTFFVKKTELTNFNSFLSLVQNKNKFIHLLVNIIFMD